MNKKEMGEVASVVKAFSCSDCVKFVCNSMHMHSSCFECCEFDFETDQIDLPDDASEYSVEVTGCCWARKD